MASLTDITAPGAYPTTPLAEEPTSQTQHAEMHRRQDPHARGSGLGQETHPSGHNFAGSGIYVDESSLAHGADHHTTSSQRNPFQQTSRSKEIPRSLENDISPRSRQFTDNSAAGVDDSSLPRAGESDKPGLMTGAYSRVGTRDSSFAPIGNYTYDKTSPSDSTHPASSQLHTDARRAGTATDPQSANPAFTTGTTTDGDAEPQSGSQRDSNAAKHEPYWGDIPFGTGVYNGVTGHGSKEPITHQGSLHDEYGTPATSHGVYNGVTGHGSKESETTPKVSNEWKRDNTTTNANETSQKRMFPLVDKATGSTAAAATSDGDRDRKLREHGRERENAPESGSGSHVKEVLAGAGATGAAGYAAHGFLGRDRDADGKDTHGRLAGEKSVVDQGGSVVAHGRRDWGAAHAGEGRQGLVDRTVAAAPVAQRAGYRTSERQSGNDPAKEKDMNDDSHLGYLGAAAAATGVGAGAYGVHEYAARDTAKENSSARGGSEVLMAAPSSTTRELAQRDTQLTNDDVAGVSNQRLERDLPKGNMLSSGGEYSGLAGRGVKQSDNLSPSGLSHDKARSNNGGVAGMMPGDARATKGNVIADPSHGGRYNTLSSGTPSGIALDPAHSAKSGH
ncbi:hypothetical protein F5B18DRAFT_541506 [Nemania serpens]|nr:hypothetical protein F5B18DRAFT_541506 [Nemania serpens]